MQSFFFCAKMPLKRFRERNTMKHKGDNVSGWVIVDKPAGIGSTAVVGIVRRLFNAAKAGHAGTLDPAASGVLPVALGEATKTVPYVMDGEKTYAFTVKFGESTTTDDADGTVSATGGRIPSENEIRAVLPSFVGEIEQIPPKYSAVHVNGQRAYDLARKEVEIALEPRLVRIDDLRLAGFDAPDSVRFEVDCGKGTYVRSIARDLAEKLGTFGHVTALRRLKCGKFRAEKAFLLEKLRETEHSLLLTDVLLPVETVLDDIPALALTEGQARLLSNGGFLTAPFPIENGTVMRADCNGRTAALVCVSDGIVRPVRVLNQSE